METFKEDISLKQEPGKPPSLEEQLARFQDDLLNSQCTVGHLDKLTDTFSEWQSHIGIGLGLTMVEINDIETAWPRDPPRQRMEMFRKWKVKLDKQATYRYEIKAFTFIHICVCPLRMHALYTHIRFTYLIILGNLSKSSMKLKGLM